MTLFFVLLWLGGGQAPALQAAAPAAPAEALVFEIDAARSTLTFSVDSTLHVVHGTAPKLSGEARIDPAAQKATALLRIEAAAMDTGNGSRDHRMREEVLDVRSYKQIVYEVKGVEGEVENLIDGKPAHVTLQGQLTMRGRERALSVPATITRDEAGGLIVEGRTTVDLDRWQVPDVSGVLLRVKRSVVVEFRIAVRALPRLE